MDFSFIDKKDRITHVIDGEKTEMINANGILQLAAHGMFHERIPECANALQRYCQYISIHGYKGGAKKAFHRLKSMEYGEAVIWLKSTHEKYVTDDIAMVTYVFQTCPVRI